MAQAENATVTVEAGADAASVRLAGTWTWRKRVPTLRESTRVLEGSSGPIVLEASELAAHDSTLVAFVLSLHEWAGKAERELRWEALPEDTQRLLDLATQVPAREGTREDGSDGESFLVKIGRQAEDAARGAIEVFAFTGAYTEAGVRLLTGRARLRWRDFWSTCERVGVDALPIVALISFLVGVIISFLGAVTLKKFAAEFAVAYLVGYGMLREMGAIMTGIIMAGRTGAAFAAEIGSMKVNEEIDALKTFGISPIEYLVLPRLLAMVLMMPFLTAFSNIIGIIGGWMVADFLMGLPGNVFFADMNFVVEMEDLFLGIFKGTVFGYLIASAGCLRGLQCGTGASAVGVSTTRAVVTSITLIIIATAIIDWAAATLGI